MSNDGNNSYPPEQSAPPAGQYQQNPYQQQYAAPAANVPGKTLGIVGFILAFLLPLIGLILSIVAKVQSKKAGVPNGLATGGIIIGAIFTVGYIIGIIVLIASSAFLLSQCGELGNGIHDVNGVTVTCNI